MDEKETATAQNVTLYPSDRVIISDVMNRLHTNNLSAALQFIIRDWSEKMSQTTYQTPAKKTAKG